MITAGTLTGAACAAGAPSRAAVAPAAKLQVIASGLNQPKKITVAPDGALIVALSGDGAAPASCTTGDQASCLDASGAVDRITPAGVVTPLLTGLPSVSSGAGVAAGPSEARLIGGRLQVLFQDSGISFTTGLNPYGGGGALLGDLAAFSGATRQIEARFGPFEAAHHPFGVHGTDVALHEEPAVDSDPYDFVAYRGGYAVADAGGNDVLFVSRSGAISVLGVLPTITETAPPGTYGSRQTTTIRRAVAQPVPTALAVGPDGALYVGELGGTPYNVGRSSVYRIVPGHAPTVYARGLTSISDIAFDGRALLVLEIDRKGLLDPALDTTGRPAPGELVSIAPGGRRSVLASAGLEFPTGMTVAPGGAVYVVTQGISDATADNGGGEVVRVTLP